MVAGLGIQHCGLIRIRNFRRHLDGSGFKFEFQIPGYQAAHILLKNFEYFQAEKRKTVHFVNCAVWNLSFLCLILIL